jgi:3-(3-hydroxy-phenyl)propionate hydroxylase
VRPLYHWRTSRAHAYTDSPLNAARDDAAEDDNRVMAETGIAAGEPLANVALGEGKFLLDHMAHGAAAGFVLLVVGDVARVLGTDIPALLDQLRTDGGGARLLGVNHPEAVARYAGHHGQAVYLVRPDHHICARWLTLNSPTGVASLRAALARTAGGRP